MSKKDDYKEARKNLVTMATNLNLVPSSKQGKSLQLALDLLDNVSKFDIVTLCGSTRFKDEFFRVYSELSLQGKMVLMPAVFSHADNIELSEDQEMTLKILHCQKIYIADEIYVINPGDYIGEQLTYEILYAMELGKDVTFMEKTSFYEKNEMI